MPLAELVAVAGYAAMVNLRRQIVMLPLEELDDQYPFCFRQLGLLVHSISPANKDVDCRQRHGSSALQSASRLNYDFFDVLANVEAITRCTVVPPHFGQLTFVCRSCCSKVCFSAKVFRHLSHANS
jgi:hypothetical protein